MIERGVGDDVKSTTSCIMTAGTAAFKPVCAGKSQKLNARRSLCVVCDVYAVSVCVRYERPPKPWAVHMYTSFRAVPDT